MPVIALWPVEDAALDALFDQMRDPEAVRMAAFTAENPDIVSLRVLQKAGSDIVGTENSYASGRHHGIGKVDI